MRARRFRRNNVVRYRDDPPDTRYLGVVEAVERTAHPEEDIVFVDFPATSNSHAHKDVVGSRDLVLVAPSMRAKGYVRRPPRRRLRIQQDPIYGSMCEVG